MMEQAVFLQGRAKDGKCLLRDGYLFKIGKRTSKKSYYACLVSKCSSTVSLDPDEKLVLSSNGIEHNHAANPAEIEVRKFHQKLRQNVLDQPNTAIPQLYKETLSSIHASSEVLSQIPTFSGIKNYMYKVRASVRPPLPKTIEVTTDGSDFLMVDEGIEDNKIMKKPSASAAATKPSQPTFEPEVVMKGEPIDIDDSPVPSTSRTDPEFILPCTDSFLSGITVVPSKDPVPSISETDHEFILPCTKSFQSGIPVLSGKDPIPSTSGTDHEFTTPCTDSFQSGTTLTVGEAFSVTKTEPVDEDEQQTNSNGNTRKASIRQAVDRADVGHSESPSNEDSAVKINNAKDHAFQCTIGEVYSLVKSGQVVEQQQVAQKPHWYKTSNSTKTQSSQKQTFVADQSLPVEDVSLTSENESAKSHLDDYGKYIAGELKMLDSKSCAHVQRVIADLLFDAKLGKFK